MGSAGELLADRDLCKNWDHVAEDCDGMEGIADAVKQRARDAVQVLRKALGEEFISNSDESKHPLLGVIFNRSPWTRYSLIELAEAIERVYGAEEGAKLVRKLRDPKLYPEAVDVLFTASNFIGQDFKVYIEPKVKIAGKPKSPDLAVRSIDGLDQIYVELTSLSRSDAEERSWHVFHLVGAPPNFCSVPHSGRLLRIVSRKRSQQLANQIADLVERAKICEKFEELVIPNTLEIAVAGQSQISELESWSAARNLSLNSFPPRSIRQMKLAE